MANESGDENEMYRASNRSLNTYPKAVLIKLCFNTASIQTGHQRRKGAEIPTRHTIKQPLMEKDDSRLYGKTMGRFGWICVQVDDA